MHILKVRDICKNFDRTQALKNVSFDLKKEEVLGVLGDNGAGKSTLAKIISGLLRPDKGEIYFEGKKVEFKNPLKARTAGIQTVYQEMTLVDVLTGVRNFFLGLEPKTRFGLLDMDKMKKDYEIFLAKIGIKERDPERIVSTLSGGEKQSISIARGIYFRSKLLILDEPTAALSVREASRILNLIKSLRKSFKFSVIVITHNIYHVYEVADRFVFLDRGVKIGESKKSEVSVQDVIDTIASGEMHK